MLSFRSFFIAAAAFATLASASPTANNPSGAPNNAARGLISVGGLFSGSVGHSGGGVCSNVCGGFVSGYGLAGLGNFLGGVLHSRDDVPVDSFIVPDGSHTIKREDPPSTGDIIKTLYDGVKLIIVKIDVAVNVEGGAQNVDRSLIAELLKEIVALIKVAILDLKAVVEVVLTISGVVVTLKDLAGIIADLIVIIIQVILLILSILGADVTICTIISIIINLIAELLILVLELIVGLKIELVYILKPILLNLLNLCDFTLFAQVLVILGIFL